MRRILSYVLFLLVLISACAPCQKVPSSPFAGYVTTESPRQGSFVPDQIPVFIDKDFTPEGLLAVKQALVEWNFALNGYRLYTVRDAKFDFVKGDIETLKKTMATGQGLLIMSNTIAEADRMVDDAKVLAWVPQLNAPLIHVVMERMGYRDVKMVVMHEIGHTMGLPHTSASGTLMSQYYEDQVSCVDQYTTISLAGLPRWRAFHWNWRQMNHCPRP
jgi:hypothetical protein